jgi:hypothetical protein
MFKELHVVCKNNKKVFIPNFHLIFWIETIKCHIGINQIMTHVTYNIFLEKKNLEQYIDFGLARVFIFKM